MSPIAPSLTPAARVWLITGASRGLGRAFTEAALAAGDRVVATARDVSPLAALVAAAEGRLVALSLDVSDRAAVFARVAEAVETFGRLDVVVNNAGQFLYGMIEEMTEAQIRAHMDTNFFGALWVSQAVIPHLRAQGGGRLLQVTSMAAGVGGGVASVGGYAASKAALDAASQCLAMELEPFGIKVIVLQPGGYETELFTRGTTVTEELPVYAPLRARLSELWTQSVEAKPEMAAAAVMEAVALENPPQRLILGGVAFDQIRQLSQERTAEYERWEALSRKAD